MDPAWTATTGHAVRHSAQSPLPAGWRWQAPPVPAPAQRDVLSDFYMSEASTAARIQQALGGGSDARNADALPLGVGWEGGGAAAAAAGDGCEDMEEACRNGECIMFREYRGCSPQRRDDGDDDDGNDDGDDDDGDEREPGADPASAAGLGAGCRAGECWGDGCGASVETGQPGEDWWAALQDGPPGGIGAAADEDVRRAVREMDALVAADCLGP
jgi:hypothetical protein